MCVAACRTLWIGDLAYWMDENFLYSLFAPTGALVNVKVMSFLQQKLSPQ